MIVDCDDCTVRGDACSDCVVSVLLGTPQMPPVPAYRVARSHRRIDLEQEEREALAVLAEQGLVPRLRLVSTAVPDTSTRPSDATVEGKGRAAG